MCFDHDWTPQLLTPTAWRPYNLSPSARIREAIRPYCASRGTYLRYRATIIQGVLMSVLLSIGAGLVMVAVLLLAGALR
jgi:hypothetical protein